MLSVVFVAETVPSFGPLVDFIGGSTLSLSSLVFPCIFYLYLKAGKNMEKKQSNEKNEQTILSDGAEKITLSK